MAQAATYYVDNSGSPACSNSASGGTQTAPWCTINYGIGRISGGDTLYVKAGTYREAIYITRPAGSSGSPTVIRAYPGHTVNVLGDGVNSGRVKIENTSYITLDGFNISNFNQGIHVNGSSNIVVQNNDVHHVGQEGIHVQFNSSYVTIQNNKVHDTRQWQYNGEGIYVGSGSTAATDNTNNVLVKGNTVYNTNDEGIELKPGTHDNIVDGNILYNVTQDSAWQATWGAIEIGESSNVGGGNQSWGSNPNHIVRNNIIHDAKTAIRPGTGSLVYNNIIYNTPSPYYGIYVNNLVGDSYTRRVYHNTVDMPSSRAIVVNGGTSDVKNNIGSTASGNMATADALYVSKSSADYHLASGSAAINAGSNLTSYVPVDIEGASRTSNTPDMGAYEYAGVVSGGDTTSPSVPSSLSASATSSSSIALSWSASTDNVAVTGYRIFRGSTQIGTTTAASYTDTGLTASTQYTYRVAAYDAAGNVSALSSASSATTQSAPSGGGNTISAASCSQSNVQAAVNSAANGDTVLVPAGNCTWTSRVNITGKGITLQGAGIDQTTIVDNVPSDNTLHIDVSSSYAMTRVTGFTFNANNTAKTAQLGEITLDALNDVVDKFRLDNFKISNLRSRGVLVWMNGRDFGGVVDSCQINASGSFSAQGVTIEGAGPQDRRAFSRPLTLGSNRAIYVEDCTFNYSSPNDGVQDAYTGARYVFRNNTINGTTIGHHGADSGEGAGVASFEIYNNTFNSAGVSSISRIMFFRSGTGVVFGNTASTAGGGSFSEGIICSNYRTCGSYTFWGQCNGSSAWDGNQSGKQGYPCVDQVGYFFAEAKGGGYSRAPLYLWGNTLNGSRTNASAHDLCSLLTANHMLENREFYNQVSNFNGSSGVGTGPLSSRPPSCTAMTGYYATDTNTLYQCGGNGNSWSAYYTPYTYPHPLRGVSVPSNPPPAAPSNLTATVQ